ncbi:YitT family protein [Proteinivorax tanatarense]|uniref:YitT family protein n=1 Tax=Proteinivorax tanatarense TaxID=1260629 RepID=A0AAU7VK36_9FIRM
MRSDLKRFALINLGVLVMAIGLYYFLIPADLAVGGVTGLAMVINNAFPVIPIGVVMIVSNLILFTLAFIIIGRDFGGYTIYASFLLSIMIYLFEVITPMEKALVEDLMVNLIYGILIQGVGMAIIFYQNASTGGTDIVAKIINKYFHLEIGKALLLSDFIIVFLAGISFGATLGMYAMLGVILNAFVIDNVIQGINKKMNIYIISNKSLQINDFIINTLDRGCTVYYADGGFSKGKKEIINTVVNKKEYVKIKKFVNNVDPKAFITVGVVHEVTGEGFSRTI